MVVGMVAVEEPAKAGPVIPLGFTERSPHGVEEPTPRRPADVNVDDAVPPNDAKFAERALAENAVPVAFVKLMFAKLSVVVVALFVKRYPKFA